MLLWLTELKISGKVSDILEANGITDKCQLLSMDPVANEMSNRMNVAEKRAFSKALLSLKPGSTNVVPAMAGDIFLHGLLSLLLTITVVFVT